jgi:hypothetical protein
MTNLIVASLRKNAGKTSFIVGLAQAMDTRFGYLKPFGDRLLYRKKRLWDYDSAVCTAAMGAEESPEEMSLGFDHSKLRFMYDRAATEQKLLEMHAHNAKGKAAMLVEAGMDLGRGVSVHLDALSLCKFLNGKLVVVLSGENDQVCDDAVSLKRQIDLSKIDLAGVVINKVRDIDDFRAVYQEIFDEIQLPILGILPFVEDLTYPTMQFISDVMFAKVLAGEKALVNVIKKTFVGAMSADAVLRVQRFKESEKLVITSGDRSDMILAALDTNAAGIILTNNLLPPANLIAKASNRNIPLLLVPKDTFQTAKKIDELIPLLGKEETIKMELLGKLVKENVNLKGILG